MNQFSNPRAFPANDKICRHVLECARIGKVLRKIAQFPQLLIQSQNCLFTYQILLVAYQFNRLLSLCCSDGCMFLRGQQTSGVSKKVMTSGVVIVDPFQIFIPDGRRRCSLRRRSATVKRSGRKRQKWKNSSACCVVVVDSSLIVNPQGGHGPRKELQQ